MVRHGEKPPEKARGQLDCQGLNRALALPSVLARFGKPAAIFAANPTKEPADDDKLPSATHHSYVRPLATIEPYAISLGMPVNAEIAANDIKGLQHELLKPEFSNALVVVAWEHLAARRFAEEMLKSFGQKDIVPRWLNSDYETIYIFRIATARTKSAPSTSPSSTRTSPNPSPTNARSSTHPNPKKRHPPSSHPARPHLHPRTSNLNPNPDPDPGGPSFHAAKVGVATALAPANVLYSMGWKRARKPRSSYENRFAAISGATGFLGPVVSRDLSTRLTDPRHAPARDKSPTLLRTRQALGRYRAVIDLILPERAQLLGAVSIMIAVCTQRQPF